MKKSLISIILVSGLILSLSGCSTSNKGVEKAQGNKPAVTAVSKQPSTSAQKNSVPKAPSKTSAPVKETPKLNTASTAKPKTASIPFAKEYFQNAPVTAVDAIQISPKHVYYKDSKLYMDAFIYNGFQHTVFDVRNVSIRISNGSGVIAEANFNGVINQHIGPSNYIVWTFIFSKDAVKQQGANLETLRTDYRCNNSY